MFKRPSKTAVARMACPESLLRYDRLDCQQTVSDEDLVNAFLASIGFSPFEPVRTKAARVAAMGAALPTPKRRR